MYYVQTAVNDLDAAEAKFITPGQVLICLKSLHQQWLLSLERCEMVVKTYQPRGTMHLQNNEKFMFIALRMFVCSGNSWDICARR